MFCLPFLLTCYDFSIFIDTDHFFAALREQAAGLAGQGSSTAPVGTPLEGLARVAQAGAGAYMKNRADTMTPANQVAMSLANSGQPAYPGASAMDQGFDTSAPVSQNPGVFGLLSGIFGR